MMQPLDADSYPLTQQLLQTLLNVGELKQAPIFTPLQKSNTEENQFRLMPQMPSKKEYGKSNSRNDKHTVNLENLESMIDLFLIGKDHQGRPEIHLSLKDDIVDGLYIRLQKNDEGTFHALFITKTFSMKNQLSNHIEMLLKLQTKGSKIPNHEIIVGDTMPDFTP